MRIVPLLASLATVSLLPCASGKSAPAGKPTQNSLTWPTATPESQGLSAAKLAALKDSLAAKQTKTFLLLRNGRVVYEWYAAGHAAGKKHYAASLSKPIVAALALALLLGEGRVKLDDRASSYIPQWADDRRKSRITLRHLGSHTSGLADAEDRGLPHEKLTDW